MTLPNLLVLSFLMFSIGLFGVLSRRHVVAMLLSIELMFNAANLAILSAAWSTGKVAGIVLVLFGMAVTVSEVAVGLALFVLAERVRRTAEADDLDMMRG